MKVFDFMRDAGEKLKGSDDKDEQPAVRTMDAALADKRTGEALTRLVAGMKLDVQGLEVKDKIYPGQLLRIPPSE